MQVTAGNYRMSFDLLTRQFCITVAILVGGGKAVNRFIDSCNEGRALSNADHPFENMATLRCLGTSVTILNFTLAKKSKAD